MIVQVSGCQSSLQSVGFEIFQRFLPVWFRFLIKKIKTIFTRIAKYALFYGEEKNTPLPTTNLKKSFNLKILYYYVIY